MRRRDFLAGAAARTGGALLANTAMAKVPTAFAFDVQVPMDNKDKFIAWAVANRGEDPKFLAERFDRFTAMVRNEDIWDDRHKKAFLLTPREKFVLEQNLPRAYEHAFLDIGWGVTISGPHIVGRMTSTIDPKQGEKVLEIGTGSGYQSAYLSHLTPNVFTIEIIKPLAERTRATYDSLAKDGYAEFGAITSKNADGYYGWEDKGPFDGADRGRHLGRRAAQGRRHHGHPRRSARRPARAEGRQDQSRGRHGHRRPLRHLRRPHRSLRALHQARGRLDQGHAQQLMRNSLLPLREKVDARSAAG